MRFAAPYLPAVLTRQLVRVCEIVLNSLCRVGLIHIKCGQAGAGRLTVAFPSRGRKQRGCGACVTYGRGNGAGINIVGISSK